MFLLLQVLADYTKFYRGLCRWIILARTQWLKANIFILLVV